MNSHIFNVKVAPLVSSSMGTLCVNLPEPSKILTQEMLIELARVNDAFCHLNHKNEWPLTEYLDYLSICFKGEDWHQQFADFSRLLGKVSEAGYDVEAEGFDREHLEEWLGKPTDFMKDVFKKIQTAFSSKNVPEYYMSFMLHKAGQPILPNAKLGWQHAQDFR